jgi:hypothetical protein
MTRLTPRERLFDRLKDYNMDETGENIMIAVVLILLASGIYHIIEVILRILG